VDFIIGGCPRLTYHDLKKRNTQSLRAVRDFGLDELN
jgi:hypothetical protein